MKTKLLEKMYSVYEFLSISIQLSLKIKIGVNSEKNLEWKKKSAIPNSFVFTI
mgnify:CR=1 FL=1